MQKELNLQGPCTQSIDSTDINKKLLSDANEIFSEDLKTDFSTTVSESVSIKDIAESNSNIISDAQSLKLYGKELLSASSPIIWEYHKSEIENVNKIISSILEIVRSVSFTTIALVALFVIFDKDMGALISLITGGVIDAILGVVVGLFNSTLKSKKSYFDSESDSVKFNKMLFLVQIIADKDKKDSVIVDILRKHFDISDGK